MDVPRNSTRTVSRFSQAEAVEEACRRLQVMHSKWPDTPWRMAIRRERHRGNPRWMVWAIYCTFPSDA